MTMINDSHCHFLSSRFLELLTADGRGADAVAAALGWEPPASVANLADRWVFELDRQGVARTALIASIPGDGESVAEAVSRHPRRFIGFFMHNPAADDADERLDQSLSQLQLRGVCLFPAMHGYRLDEPRVERVFAAASAHRAVVFAHCGALTVGVRKKLGLPSRFDWRLGDPLALARTALGFPDVPVIIPHFGAGYLRETLMAADQCPTIHLDTSSSNGWTKYHCGLTLMDVFRQALSVAGPSRLLFGTDSSFFPRGWQRPIYDGQLGILEELGVVAADRDKLVHENFDRLFPQL
jgi:predicted TIM-barrel fold metal-dependent hydrolase